MNIFGHVFNITWQAGKSTVTSPYSVQEGVLTSAWDESVLGDCQEVHDGFKANGGTGLLVTVRHGEGEPLKAAANYAKVCAEAGTPLIPFFENAGTSKESVQDWISNQLAPSSPTSARITIAFYKNAWEGIPEDDLRFLGENYLCIGEGMPPKAANDLGWLGTHYGVNVIDPTKMEEMVPKYTGYVPYALSGWDTIDDAAAADAAPHLRDGGGMIWPPHGDALPGSIPGPSTHWFTYQMSRAQDFQTEGLIFVALTEQIEDSNVWPSEKLGSTFDEAMGCMKLVAEVAQTEEVPGGEDEPGEPSDGSGGTPPPDADQSPPPSGDSDTEDPPTPGDDPSGGGSGTDDPEKDKDDRLRRRIARVIASLKECEFPQRRIDREVDRLMGILEKRSKMRGHDIGGPDKGAGRTG